MIKSRLRQSANALILLSAIAMAAFQVGCGGGDGNILAGGGIGGTGATISSVGTLTGFGSVIVNGVIYDTTAAEVFVENISGGSGNPAVSGNLSTGMVVRVEGRIEVSGNAKADRVYFSSNLKGPVESISVLDAHSKQAIILGQRILMDDRTVFRNTAAATIALGMVLEVSGYHDDSGGIFATYINKAADSPLPDEPVEIKGIIGNLLPLLKTFEMSGLTVDYSAAIFSGLPGNAPEAGQLLKVRGKQEAANRLVAEFIEVEEEFGSRVFTVVDLGGIITQAEQAGEFRIGRFAVRVSPETSYINLASQDLNRGIQVIVRGALTGRVILAEAISLPEKVRIESNVSSIDLVEKSLVPAGLEAATIFMTAMTHINGIAPGFDGIAPGNHVRILGRRTAGGDILASMILVTPSNNLVELAGSVESISEPFAVILGIEVDTSSIPADGFKGVNGKKISAGEFFGALRPDDNAAVKGVLQAGRVNWTEIALE
jgi:hypothetical protein